MYYLTTKTGFVYKHGRK